MPVASQDPLYAAAYAELHRLARRERRRVGAPATINTTALVHEAWFKLGRSEAGAEVERSDFLAIAAHAMRQVLVDHARRVNAQKRRHVAVTLGEAEHEPPASIALLDLDAALNALEAIDERLARIVELHVFCGLEFAEIAESEGISERSVFRLWRTARVFLMDALAA
ncbi:ECF-type sigma factor [Dokdonella sp.]|uniref:ECF-type sigma factor n=1 Tax=Dokdonella sp. TaxID=2291710 RepID=UPI0037842167